jgi:hypothetical protein
VLILYDGHILRELSGEALNEENIVASALNLTLPAAAQEVPA